MAELTDFEYDVFISYSHTNHEWVRGELLPQLEKAGLKVVIDYRDFEVGVSSLVNMERAVDSSAHTLVVLTPAWVESEWAEFESLLVGTSDPTGRKRRLIPLMLVSCQPPSRIAMLTYADFTDPELQATAMIGLLRALGRVPESVDLSVVPRRLFISYKRNSYPDEKVALEVFRALSEQHEVFIDQTLLVGTLWAERIETELRHADFLIVFLSAQSIRSEMVLAEISTAYHIARLQQGRPAILPVRLAYREAFQYPLSFYLDRINWALWQEDKDTPRLIDELRQAISGGLLSIDKHSKARILQASQIVLLPEPLAAAQPVRSETPAAHLEMPEGTMDPQSSFYVERDSDQIVLDAIGREGVTVTIKGPRQIGKSSLLMRVMKAARDAGKHTVFLDFQLFEKSTLADAEAFFRQFCALLTDELNIEDQVRTYWDMPLGNSQRCTRYMGRHILETTQQPLLLAMDEVESIFEADFRSDFFGMLRSWHNSRRAGSIWSRLDLALVTSTEPYQFIENLNQSPFNVGEIVELADFTPTQVGDLNRRHGSPLNADQEQRLTVLLNGHPYLVRRALYLIASRRLSVGELFDHAGDERGPFSDHLRYHLFRLHGKHDLIDGLRQIIQHHTCRDERIFFRLSGAGLVRREGRMVFPRCQLYADYFREHLDG